jgi:hypothetical protein
MRSDTLRRPGRRLGLGGLAGSPNRKSFSKGTGADAQQTLDYLARLHMQSLLRYHFCLRGYEGREIVDLRENGYTDCDLMDMYSLLQNRLFRQVDDIVSGSTRSVEANA